MNIKYLIISITSVLLISIGVLSYNNMQLQKRNQFKSNTQNKDTVQNSDDTLNYPAEELTEIVKTSLTKALDDEYKAQATYEAIINKLGNVRPFIMIISAEEQHISSLKSLFDKYGMVIPQNPYIGKVTSPVTLTEACKAGVSAEISNAALYKETLLPAVKNYEDITLVFTNLMNASQQKHLVAFQKCD